MFLMTQGKKLSRRIGASYNATWSLKHKLMQVMLEQNSTKKLTGRIEIDDSYLGGKRAPSKRGRGATGKSPFVATIETHDGRPYLMKLSRIKGFQLTEIARWSNHHLSPHSNVVPDGLACFKAVEKANRSHERHVVGGGKKAVEHPSFKWVNTILGKLKNFLRGTFHTFQEKHISSISCRITAARPCAPHIDFDPAEIFCVSSGRVYEGKKCNSYCPDHFGQKKNDTGMHFWARGFLFQQLVPMRKL